MRVETLSNEGTIALQKGDFQSAKRCFEQATTLTDASPEIWLGLATACEGLKDYDAQNTAIDRALDLNPRHLRALIAKGDLLDRNGEIKAAGGFYGSALSVSRQLTASPSALMQDLQRAQKKCQEYAIAYEAYLRNTLDSATVETNESSNGAFARSLDIMFGKRQVYLQQPQKYYFPDLPSIQFYDRNQFTWIEDLEKQTSTITNELKTLLNDGENFSPYVTQKIDTPRTDHMEMFDNPDWSAFFLWKDGVEITENANRFPKTIAALKDVPLAQIPGHSPSILFSLLRPTSKIPPHTGLINSRLIVHLPLIIPTDCALRVGNDTRNWKEGEVMVFDDTIQHEAWNNSKLNRYVLIFDIGTPFMTSIEHTAVRDLFSAIDQYS